MDDIEKIKNLIENLKIQIFQLQVSQDNSKYVNACYNQIICDLNDMISFFNAELLKIHLPNKFIDDKDHCIICGSTENVEQDQGFYYCKEHMKDALL